MGKLGLGTVQFGLDYGVSNNSGKVKKNEVEAILKYYKVNNGVYLDTASAYGDAEQVLGDFDLTDFKIISKFTGNDIGAAFKKTLKDLNVSRLYAFLYHRFNDFIKDEDKIEDLLELKKNELLENIGFSLYDPKELEYLLDNNIPCDIVQIPFNVIDRRFEEYLPELAKQEIKIHTRSTFLQGLFFMDEEKCKSKVPGSELYIKGLNNLSNKYNTNVLSLVLNFVLMNKYVESTIIGCTSLSELQNNLDAVISSNLPLELELELDNIRINDINIINPSKWKR